MACPPPDPFAGPGWPRFTPEQIEEGRRYGLELDPAKCIDFSEFIRNLIAELEAGDGPTGGRTTDDGGGPGPDDGTPAGGRP